MAVRAPVKGRKEGGAEETKEGNGEKREGEGIMGERGGQRGCPRQRDIVQIAESRDIDHRWCRRS